MQIPEIRRRQTIHYHKDNQLKIRVNTRDTRRQTIHYHKDNQLKIRVNTRDTPETNNPHITRTTS